MSVSRSTESRPLPTIALVGCGAIAESFYLPALVRNPAMRDRIILVDSHRARAEQMAGKFHVVRYVTDYREVLDSVKACIVAVPHHLHFAVARDFLRAGAHVLCEKPIAEEPAQVREMVRMAADRQVTIAVNQTRRLYPANLKVKALLERGAIGMVRSVSYIEGAEFNWQSASGFYFDWRISTKGVLFDLGAHVLDLLCWWLGGKPAIVTSENDSFGGCESVAGLTLDHKGCRCTIRLSRLHRLRNTFELVGERGAIAGEPSDWRSIVHTDAAGKVTKHVCQEHDFSAIAIRLMDNLLAVVEGTARPLVPATEVLNSVELMEAAYQHATRFAMPWYTIRKEVTPDH